MLRRNLVLQMLALAALVLFSWCLVRLLLFRYERGDVFPAYSTLRADPYGTRAFYEALQSNGFAVRRGYHSLRRELEDKPDAIYYLGLSADEILTFNQDDVADLDAYVRSGGRVVIAFAPEDPLAADADEPNPFAPKDKPDIFLPKKKSDDKAKTKELADKDADEDKTPPKTAEERYERDEFREEKNDDPDWDKDHLDTKFHPSLAALWGFGWEREVEHKKAADDSTDSSANDADVDLPEVLAYREGGGTLDENVPWKSALYFARIEPDWNILYNAKQQPVMMSRPLGQGEVVVATDSYFLSNEGLRNDRRANLLSLVAGPSGSLLFDEVHLGTQQQDGVVALAEKFHLQGYIFGLACVFALILWRNSVPLVPPHPVHRPAQTGSVSGKDSRSGLINLLRRNIPSSEILRVSFAEWNRSITPGQNHAKAKVAAMESILAARPAAKSEEIVAIYHELSAINLPSRKKGHHAAKP